MSDTSNFGAGGQSNLYSGNSEYNVLQFLMWVFAGGMATGTIAEVKAVHPGAGLLQGTVDVLPLVNMTDSDGNSVPHGIVYGLPYGRVQAGSSAVIMDPVIGDIGAVLFASRDISAVKSIKAQANPGSARRFNYADGMYLFSILGTVDPTQYVKFLPSGGGITAVSPSDITINGVIFTPGGKVTAPGDVIAGGPLADGGTSLQNHVQTNGGGIGNSGPPAPGT